MTLEPENWQLLADLGTAEGQQWFYLPGDATGSSVGQALIAESDCLLLHAAQDWQAAVQDNPCLWQSRCRCGKKFPSRRAVIGHISGLLGGLNASQRQRVKALHEVIV